MFRSLFRRNRTIRVPIESSGHNVREVRVFKNALSRPSNFLTTFFITYFLYRILEQYTIPKDVKDQKSKASLEELRKNNPQIDQLMKEQGLQSGTPAEFSESWKKAHEAIRKDKANGNIASASEMGMDPSMPPDVLATITLPIWIRARKSSLYQPEDQEYQDYVRIQSDKKKIGELKQQVGDWAATRLKNPTHAVNMNYIGFNGQIAVVLELVPQLHPPPLYEMPALILFKDGVSVGWKTLRPDLGTRMESMLKPGVTYEAAKASLSAFFNVSYAIAKARFSGDNTLIVHMQSHVHTPNAVMSEKSTKQNNDVSPLSQWPTNSQAMQEFLRTVHTGKSARQQHSDLVKNMPFSVAVQFAAATFRRRQLQGLAHAQQNRARGVIQVRGVIVCMGARGKYRMEVLAFYLPSEDKFLGPLIMRNAYIVKDYSQWQRLEEKKQKDAYEKRLSGNLHQKPSGEEHSGTEKKPTAGKEEE